ncbi:MAG: WH2 domain-containing protein [Candidatus Rickettsia vulgarisii]
MDLQREVGIQEKLPLASSSTEFEQVKNSNIPPPPPPPPTPPLPSPTNEIPVTPKLDERSALMEAIRQGINLRKVTDQKIPDNSNNSNIGNPFVNELEKRLKLRKAELGGEQEIAIPAGRFAEEAKLFEQARREEAERQARIEKLENEKVEAALAKKRLRTKK